MVQPWHLAVQDGSEAQLVTASGNSAETRDFRTQMRRADRRCTKDNISQCTGAVSRQTLSLVGRLDCFTSWGDPGEKVAFLKRWVFMQPAANNGPRREQTPFLRDDPMPATGCVWLDRMHDGLNGQGGVMKSEWARILDTRYYMGMTTSNFARGGSIGGIKCD